MSIFKHIQSIILLPTMVTVVIPGIIIYRTGTLNVGWSLPPPLSLAPSLGGIALLVLGLTLMAKTIALFANVGQGTLAPWAPPERLVVRGIYRHVRNPMLSGVLFVLCGEALLIRSIPLLEWFGLFLLINLIYIPLLEEPVLDKRFGQPYRLYRQNVPRWIPRLKPWDAPQDRSS
ncbi:MAG: methyltransferase family protein [Pyrinomonadaceae bacterium]